MANNTITNYTHAKLAELQKVIQEVRRIFETRPMKEEMMDLLL